MVFTAGNKCLSDGNFAFFIIICVKTHIKPLVYVSIIPLLFILVNRIMYILPSGSYLMNSIDFFGIVCYNGNISIEMQNV